MRRKDFLNSGNCDLETHCCVQDYEECRKVVDETMDTYGRIDVLVNNAGVVSRGESFFQSRYGRYPENDGY